MKYKLFLFALALSNFNCRNSDDCGDIKTYPYFDANGIEHLGAFTTSPSVGFTYYKSGTTISDDARLGLKLFFSAHYYGTTKAKTSFFFIQSANACTPIPSGWKGSIERFKNITLTSNSDFDADHKAGESLNEYFGIVDAEDKEVEISGFLESNPKLHNPEINFLLNKKPTLSKNHVFNLKIELQNGEVYQAKTTEMIFQ